MLNNYSCFKVIPNVFRFAVTVWYLDEKEKQEHQRRTRAEYQHPQAIRRGSNCDNLNQLKGKEFFCSIATIKLEYCLVIYCTCKIAAFKPQENKLL